MVVARCAVPKRRARRGPCVRRGGVDSGDVVGGDSNPGGDQQIPCAGELQVDLPGATRGRAAVGVRRKRVVLEVRHTDARRRGRSRGGGLQGEPNTIEMTTCGTHGHGRRDAARRWLDLIFHCSVVPLIRSAQCPRSCAGRPCRVCGARSILSGPEQDEVIRRSGVDGRPAGDCCARADRGAGGVQRRGGRDIVKLVGGRRDEIDRAARRDGDHASAGKDVQREVRAYLLISRHAGDLRVSVPLVVLYRRGDCVVPLREDHYGIAGSRDIRQGTNVTGSRDSLRVRATDAVVRVRGGICAG